MKLSSSIVLFGAVCAGIASQAQAAVTLFAPSRLMVDARVNLGAQDLQEQYVTSLPYSTPLTATVASGSVTSTFDGGQSGFDTDTSQTHSTAGSTETETSIAFTVSTSTPYDASGFFTSTGETGSAFLHVNLHHEPSGITIFDSSQGSPNTSLPTSQNFVVGGPGASVIGSAFGTLAPGNYAWTTTMFSNGTNRTASGQLSLALPEPGVAGLLGLAVPGLARRRRNDRRLTGGVWTV